MIRNTHKVETVQSRAAHVKNMLAASENVGDQRQLFEDVLAKKGADSDYVLAIQYGRAIAAVNVDGELYARPTKTKVDLDNDGEPNQIVYDEVNSGVHPKLTSFVIGAAPANKVIGSAIIPCGVCAIVALGGKGKTPLAHALAAFGVDSYSVVRVGEPLAGYTDDDDASAFGLARALLASSNVVLDSVKDLLGSGGNLMKSGISRDLLKSLSSWSTTSCETGSTVFVPINPSTDDPEVFDMLVSSTQSNATMTIAQKGDRWEYWARQGEGLPRRHGFIDMQFAKDGTVSITATEDKMSRIEASSAPGYGVNLTARVSVDAVNDSVRRSIILQDEQDL